MFDLFDEKLTPAQKKKRAAAQAQAQREDQAQAEQTRQKDLEEVTSTFEMPLLLKAAGSLGGSQQAKRKV